MNIFIDTTGKFLVIAIFNSDFQLIEGNVELLKNKADLLPIKIEEILEKNKIEISEIQSFYVNLGPGTFTGCRIGLTFCRTICQLGGKQLWISSTFNLLSFKNKEKKQYFVDYSAKSQFSAWAEDGRLVSEISEISEKFKSEDKIDYQLIFDNFLEATSLFENKKKIVDITPFYIK
ncbi:hypothetical protein [Mycoplasma sp. 'Moose RK']|uniref:hypothetical protein n=1 Tax=Mycoplasma sp. 'Moose RK' TaxID=2780095 RepID=UPI0018C27560|nr:hypothetical protein [Mycoplasma sp. 'Moose RK']MBG0730552.1 hypothetical protein [Mycoplasma sp. 'Moose RK']